MSANSVEGRMSGIGDAAAHLADTLVKNLLVYGMLCCACGLGRCTLLVFCIVIWLSVQRCMLARWRALCGLCGCCFQC
jgi:hypothetical protein